MDNYASIFNDKKGSERASEVRDGLYQECLDRKISSTLRETLVENLQDVLTSQNIKARPYKTHCRTCIITHNQVNEMASLLYTHELKEQSRDEDEDHPPTFEELSKKEKQPYLELIYAIPVAFKQLGFELYRPAEDAFINEALAEKLARVIHARFRQHMLNNNSTDVYQGMYLAPGNTGTFEKEFDDLSDDIKIANIDNAFHIPTKLLSIGYKIEPLEDGGIPPLLNLTDNEIETMAMMEHERWSWERRLNGWTYHSVRDNALKHHNCLVPYDELPPHEQEKDRVMVRFIPALLVDIGYQAVRVSPELENQISYINRQSGYVYEAETQIRNLQNLIIKQNDEIQTRFDQRFSNIECIDDLKKEVTAFHKYLSKQYLSATLQRLDITKQLLKHIEGAFNSGKNTQKTFMPNTFNLKEFFPESFVLFKPKDVVSGDFYFISKQEQTVFFTAADCTGHGISGSILSGICYNYLHEAVHREKLKNPLDVLCFVMPKVKELLRHADALAKGTGEMELALCSINLENHLLQVAAYGRPVLAFINGELVRLGKGSTIEQTQVVDGFHVQQVKMNKGDTVYTFSDGYTDQIGGPAGRKYMVKNFKNLLAQIQTMEMARQGQVLNQEIEDWRKCEGKYQCERVGKDQTDDISIIGVKI